MLVHRVSHFCTPTEQCFVIYMLYMYLHVSVVGACVRWVGLELINSQLSFSRDSLHWLVVMCKVMCKITLAA